MGGLFRDLNDRGVSNPTGLILVAEGGGDASVFSLVLPRLISDVVIWKRYLLKLKCTYVPAVFNWHGHL